MSYKSVETYWPIKLDLGNIHTHQCDFTRGYWIGYAQAEVKHRQRTGFKLRLPVLFLDDLAAALPGWKLQVVAQECNQFSVEFATVKIEPI